MKAVLFALLITFIIGVSHYLDHIESRPQREVCKRMHQKIKFNCSLQAVTLFVPPPFKPIKFRQLSLRELESRIINVEKYHTDPHTLRNMSKKSKAVLSTLIDKNLTFITPYMYGFTNARTCYWDEINDDYPRLYMKCPTHSVYQLIQLIVLFVGMVVSCVWFEMHTDRDDIYREAD